MTPHRGRIPRWSPNGTELFYQSLDGRQLLAVQVTTEPTFTTGAPEILFEGAYLAPAGTERPYDLTPDGDRFVMIKTGDDSPQIILVLNWHQELLERVPIP